MKAQLYLLLLLASSLKGHSQSNRSFGLQGVYNNPINSLGAGLRLQHQLSPHWSVNLQAQYMPSINKISETNAAVVLMHYPISNERGLSPYLFAGAMYNHWFNYSPTASKAKKNNLLADTGFGIDLNIKNFTPFVELHYNPIWNESTSSAGVRFYTKPSLKKYKKATQCPKFR